MRNILRKEIKKKKDCRNLLENNNNTSNKVNSKCSSRSKSIEGDLMNRFISSKMNSNNSNNSSSHMNRETL